MSHKRVTLERTCLAGDVQDVWTCGRPKTALSRGGPGGAA